MYITKHALLLSYSISKPGTKNMFILPNNETKKYIHVLYLQFSIFVKIILKVSIKAFG